MFDEGLQGSRLKTCEGAVPEGKVTYSLKVKSFEECYAS